MMNEGTWFSQTFADGTTIWFRADRLLKNGGWMGRLVERKGRSVKSKQTSVPVGCAKLWHVCVPPAEVVAAA